MSLGGAPQPPALLERADAVVDPRPGEVLADPPWYWVLLQLISLSFYRPLIVLGGPQRAVTSFGSAILVGVAVSVMSVVVYLILTHVVHSKWVALAWTSVGILYFWNWQGATLLQGSVHWAVSVALLVITMLGVRKWAHHRYLRYGILVSSCTLFLALGAVVLQDELTTPPASIVVTDPLPVLTFQSTPDIYLIVLDAYARADVLDAIYDFDNSEFISELEKRGFAVGSSANSNYGGTHFSIPSMLEMSYLTEDGQPIHNSDLVQVTHMIGGENTWVETLAANGYTYVHADTEHWLNRCGESVDVCLTRPRLDITVDALLAKTPIGGLIYPESGDPTTALNRERIAQLTDWSEVASELPSGPRFVSLHLVMPHPPLFLDASCSPRVDRDLEGRNMAGAEFARSLLPIRRHAYIEQLLCANRTVLRFLDQLDKDAVVVITADHGPDSLGPLHADPNRWTDVQKWERYGILSSLRLPEQCDAGPDDQQLVNTLRLVVGCLSDTEVPMLDGEWFAASYSGTVVEFKDPDANVELKQE
jgi:hypothetical protein